MPYLRAHEVLHNFSVPEVVCKLSPLHTTNTNPLSPDLPKVCLAEVSAFKDTNVWYGSVIPREEGQGSSCNAVCPAKSGFLLCDTLQPKASCSTR